MSPDRATINDLGALVITDYRVRKLWDTGDRHVAVWGEHQASDWQPAGREVCPVPGSGVGKTGGGAGDPTINRELSGIRRGFRLAFEGDLHMVRRVPHILKLDEDNARQGFLGATSVCG